METELNIELTGLTEMQATIADFLWNADSEADLKTVFETFDPLQVLLVQELMLLAVQDQVEDVSDASFILSQFKL